MFDIERWQEIFDAISKNKLRTFLTGVSVGSGIFILIILLGISDGMQRGVKKQFERDASGKIAFWGGKTSINNKGLNAGRRIRLRLDDYDYASKVYKDDIEYLSANLNNRGGTVVYKNQTGNYRVKGVMPDMIFLENSNLNAGRYISHKDMVQSAKVAVVGIRVAKDLFKNYKKAVGKTITINKVRYTVIGVYSDEGGEREEGNIFIPHTTASKVQKDELNAGAFNFSLYAGEGYNAALAKSEKFEEQYLLYLKQKNDVAINDEKAIGSYNNLEGRKKFFDISVMMNLFFWGIGILTLVAGIVGVSNIMLIIVKERTKEIGIRKALGAQPSSIVGIILHESIFITSMSGLLGLFFALGLLQLVGPKIETEFILNPNVNFSVALITVVLLIFAGAVAGFIPAYHAAKIKPIIALRDE